MPAEWEQHEATWLGWPHNPTDWPDKLDTIRWVYGEIVRKIAPGETVRMLVDSPAERKLAPRYLSRAGADLRRVEFIIHPTNRGWTRDSGPLFVRRRDRPAAPRRPSCISISTPGPSTPTGGRTAACPRPPPSCSARRLFDARANGRPFVLEGGGIEVNGRGTLLTTEECYLDPAGPGAQPGPRAARGSKRPCANTWARPMSSGWAAAWRATTRTATWTISAAS